MQICVVIVVALMVVGAGVTVGSGAGGAGEKKERALLPSGERFAFWEDTTAYRKVYHVAQEDPRAADTNGGTAEAPFRTINAAAAVVGPGEKVVVHKGVYRECVRPARGGTAGDQMVAFEAAAGERVVVRGSEVVKGPYQANSDYKIVRADKTKTPVLVLDLPEEMFRGYNPFGLRNVYQYAVQYGDLTNPVFLKRIMLRRGTVFVDGKPLKQVSMARELGTEDGAFWVEEPGTRIYLRLAGDADPLKHEVEVSVREQVFAPKQTGLGYIRVSGFVFDRAADGLPVPQRGAVSTMRGHHWIIEKNQIEWSHAVGLDIGNQTWDLPAREIIGHHIVRGNQIRQSGICGIAGAGGVRDTLVEGNTIEDVGGLGVERMWECAAIKFHGAERSLLRHNVVRRCTDAAGLWLDCNNKDNRVTDNVFADVSTLSGAIYSELNFDTNWVDHNIFWDIRGTEATFSPFAHGTAVRADCNDTLMVAHNFFGKVQGYAVSFSLNQGQRQVNGRTGMNQSNAALNNVFYQSPHRIHVGRRAETRCDGNIFDAANDAGSFHLSTPEPESFQNLAGWQKYFGLEAHSVQGRMEATFDMDTAKLEWKVEGKGPVVQAVRAGGEAEEAAGP